jgi:putative ATP-dependent endonuclease of OLD family
MTSALSAQWVNLHKGDYFADPSISFARSELENLLRHMSIGFAPGHGEQLVDFSRLSDGQQSILYLSIVLGMHEIGAKVLSGELADAFDIDKLRPAVYTLIAIEEPENSLSPHYLGRVVKTLQEFAMRQDAQAVFATHSRNAQQAAVEVEELLFRGHPEVVDLADYFGRHCQVEAFLVRIRGRGLSSWRWGWR